MIDRVQRVYLAEQSIMQARELARKFLTHLSHHSTVKGILCSVESEEDQIKIKYAGYEVACYPRTVVIESGNEIEAATEFVFDSFEKDPPEELWRFYLKRDGRLHLSLEDDSGLCDFDNPNVTICFNLLSCVEILPPIFTASCCI